MQTVVWEILGFIVSSLVKYAFFTGAWISPEFPTVPLATHRHPAQQEASSSFDAFCSFWGSKTDPSPRMRPPYGISFWTVLVARPAYGISLWTWVILVFRKSLPREGSRVTRETGIQVRNNLY